MVAFGLSFLKYFVILVILAGLSVAGIFLGKFLRDRKDTKELREADKKQNEN